MGGERRRRWSRRCARCRARRRVGTRARDRRRGCGTRVQAAVIVRSARAMLRALAVDEESLPGPVPIAVVVTPQTEPATPQLATMAGVGARFGSPGTTSSALLTLAVIWRPRTLGIALDLAIGLAPDISGTNFEGSIGDRSFAAVARVPLFAAPATTIAFSGGVAVHALRFAGATPMRTIVDWKLDPAARLGAATSYAFATASRSGSRYPRITYSVAKGTRSKARRSRIFQLHPRGSSTQR